MAESASRYGQHGAFSWNELVTTNPEEAKSFYGELFGWEYEEFQSEPTNYYIVKCAGEQIGGIMSIPPNAKGMTPNWGPYVTVDDVDEVVSRAKRLGATVVLGPEDIPDVGRFAMMRDPHGALISLIRYDRAAP